MLERCVESYLTKKHEGITYKLAGTGRIGAPDRLMLHEIPLQYRDIVSKYVYFVEVKKPGDVPRASQLREHSKLKKLGFKVEIVDKKR